MRKQQQVWYKEHVGLGTLPDMANSEPAAGVTLFIECLNRRYVGKFGLFVVFLWRKLFSHNIKSTTGIVTFKDNLESMRCLQPWKRFVLIYVKHDFFEKGRPCPVIQ
jgi:hypothetical protein